MGIQAASNADAVQMMISAVLSYNRPVYLAAAALIAYIVAYYILKKSPKRVHLSVLVAIIAVLVTAAYFILTTVSEIRY